MGDGGFVETGAPARCDGCGRDAREAGMEARGWVVSPLVATVPGSFCLSCASALRMLDWFVRCVDCGATIENETAAEQTGWRFFPDPLGQLQPHCAACSSETRGRAGVNPASDGYGPTVAGTPTGYTSARLLELLEFSRRPEAVLAPDDLRALIEWSGTPDADREALKSVLASTRQQVPATRLAPNQRRGHVSLLDRIKHLLGR